MAKHGGTHKGNISHLNHGVIATSGNILSPANSRLSATHVLPRTGFQGLIALEARKPMKNGLQAFASRHIRDPKQSITSG